MKVFKKFFKNQTKPDWSLVTEIETLPLISIGDDFTVKFPCDDDVCRRLILHCSPSLYYVDSTPIFDKTFRNSWELDASKMAINSTAWIKMFSDSKSSPILESIRKTLLPTAKIISAKFYGLFVFETASFFKAHYDFQRRFNHFGDVVIFLPCYYTGGDLILRQKGEERSYSFSYSADHLKFDTLKCRAVSFWRNCEQEAKQVRSGYRVALRYHLFYEGDRPVLEFLESIPPAVEEKDQTSRRESESTSLKKIDE